MPLATQKRYTILRELDKEWERLNKTYHRLCPRHGEIPVGGNHMDYFFRMEAVRGCQDALRSKAETGKATDILDTSIEQGKIRAREAILKWNRKREYQVHRWEKCCDDYLEHLVYRIQRFFTSTSSIRPHPSVEF